ncbi:hypothetical protein [Bradyrhizobium sp. 2S1]|uniref:hypothetical protein n=1 Tax=Bradyrhizobium sp. 2S1 TaxID=1404429 RepID=UPI00140B5D7D|nr:hypothetical protein [Bradyrhizobium sp. 2S1]MCK7673425.1 hypothetical protein [Bradyrhizobium sp. 2S1]
MLFFVDLALAPLQFMASFCDEMVRPLTRSVRPAIAGPAQIIPITPERRARRKQKILRRLQLGY